jgi:phosphoglycerol transferase MdoB-like AlkP superfamily enzyme
MLLNKIKFPNHIRFLFVVYLWGLLFFTLLRVVLLATNVSQDTLPAKDCLLVLNSFFYGFRFDTCISCYILSLPFVLLSIGSIFHQSERILLTVAHYLIAVLYCIAFFICCADIPYFNHFSARLSTSSLLWMDSPTFMLKMIFGTFSYWIYLLLFFVLCFLFVKRLNKAKSRRAQEFPTEAKTFSLRSILYFFLFSAVLFLGIRGRIAKKSPMVAGTAYFSDNNFLNQLGLNPVFTFMNSVIEDAKPENTRLNLMNDELAINNVKEYLNSGKIADSPVARNITATGEPKKMNVVIVIMEGMSRFNMGEYGGPKNITPVLDSLKNISLWFDNMYTQGIHTFNGIYSTLFSYPSLLKKHTMKRIPSKQYYSMPEILRENNYQNLFFVTHDGQFDNIQGFLTANGFDNIFSQKDYPSEKVLSTLGVPDDYMFEYSIPKMNEIAAKGRNFFCGFMTASNHDPLVFPDWAKINFKSAEDRYRIIEYSDWSIGQFIKRASKESWFNNTIFVFVADHGSNRSQVYDMPLTYHHAPLIIYAPGLHVTPQSFDCFGGQMDIFPTIMGLMNLSYVNNTMGVDLLKEKRPYIYFTADDKIGCIDKDFYFIHRMNGNESLYRYKDQSTDNYLEQYKMRADSMRSYAYSMLQTAQSMVENEKFQKGK